MNFIRPALVVCLLAMAGCKSSAPALELPCTFHQDCRLTAIGPDCCDTCEPLVGSVGSVAARTEYCARKAAAPCPKLDCASVAATPSCVEGRCIARPGIH
jgi:hypothetical protein